MTCAPVLLLLALPSQTAVEVRTLEGTAHAGTLAALDDQSLTIEAETGQQVIPLANLQEVALAAQQATATSGAGDLGPLVQLRDATRLSATAVTATSRTLNLSSQVFGEVSIPRSSVGSIRLIPLDSRVTDQWKPLLERDPDRDLVVVRKGDRLDYVDGVVGTMTDASISLLIDGSAIDIPRERVFGIIYASGGRPKQAVCSLQMTNGDRLSASSLRLEEGTFRVVVGEGLTLSLEPGLVTRIDYSLGKIRYLGDDEPAEVTYPVAVAAYDEYAWAMRRNRNSAGRPLHVGGRTYDRGLWIHSGTSVRYRLAREYRQFRALMDMDEDIGSDCNPRINVVIRGDERILFQAELKWEDDPQPLNLDVSNVRELVIEVLSTSEDGACEHLDLAEARVIR